MGMKGELTRQAILERGMSLASRQGLEAVSIGQLAAELDLSKSGLFAHFRSKEALQVQILEHAAARFVEIVVKPAIASPRGAPRLRALYERWMRWPEDGGLAYGCVFMATIFELDDRPGPARDTLVAQQRQFLETIATRGALRRPRGSLQEERRSRAGRVRALRHHDGALPRRPGCCAIASRAGAPTPPSRGSWDASRSLTPTRARPRAPPVPGGNHARK
jgi:AcrR family transcriptional regulator